MYGTRAPLRSWNPLWANLQVYADLCTDAWRARSWADRARVLFMHPGWRPADVAARWPKPAFDIRAVQRYDPPLRRSAAFGAATLFVVLLVATALFLWNAHRLSLAESAAAASAIVLGLCAVGWFGAPRRRHRQNAPDLNATATRRKPSSGLGRRPPIAAMAQGACITAGTPCSRSPTSTPTTVTVTSCAASAWHWAKAPRWVCSVATAWARPR